MGRAGAWEVRVVAAPVVVGAAALRLAFIGPAALRLAFMASAPVVGPFALALSVPVMVAIPIPLPVSVSVVGRALGAAGTVAIMAVALRVAPVTIMVVLVAALGAGPVVVPVGAPVTLVGTVAVAVTFVVAVTVAIPVVRPVAITIVVVPVGAALRGAVPLVLTFPALALPAAGAYRRGRLPDGLPIVVGVDVAVRRLAPGRRQRGRRRTTAQRAERGLPVRFPEAVVARLVPPQGRPAVLDMELGAPPVVAVDRRAALADVQFPTVIVRVYRRPAVAGGRAVPLFGAPALGLPFLGTLAPLPVHRGDRKSVV